MVRSCLQLKDWGRQSRQSTAASCGYLQPLFFCTGCQPGVGLQGLYGVSGLTCQGQTWCFCYQSVWLEGLNLILADHGVDCGLCCSHGSPCTPLLAFHAQAAGSVSCWICGSLESDTGRFNRPIWTLVLLTLSSNKQGRCRCLALQTQLVPSVLLNAAQA